MKKSPRSNLTYANVVSTLCLFLLLGGGAAFAASHLGKNSVGTKQLKANAVISEKVKDGSLQAADIGGPVDSALKATSATTAATAANAAQATDAQKLGGSPASAYKDGCPSGTKLVAKILCVTDVSATVVSVHWIPAAEACAAMGLRLPSPGEALAIGPDLGNAEFFWTDDFWTTEKDSFALEYEVESGDLVAQPSNTENNYAFCVTTPTNS